MRTRVIAAFALCLAIATPASAQLVVTSRVTLVNTSADPPTADAALIRNFAVPSNGLALKRVLQMSSSNGASYRWETTVTKIEQAGAPADLFQIPANYREVQPPRRTLLPR